MRAQITMFRPSRSYTSAPSGDTRAPAKGEAGVAGDSWYDQLLGGGPDVNPDLTASAKFDVYSEMAMTSPSIKSLILFWSLPVRAAVWGLDPADDQDPVAVAIRDAAAWNFGLDGAEGQMDLSWKELLQQALFSLLKFGPCVEELVWGDVREWRDADGDPHTLRPLARLALRPARTIQKVRFDRGRIARVEQSVPGARPIDDPRDNKLSYMVFEREDNRWDGVSPLRPCWGPWTLQKNLMIAAGVGWDRFASGLPVIYHPNTPSDEARARQIGREVRTHERAYVNFPVDGPGDTASGRPVTEWWMELLNGSDTLADATPLLRWCSEQIAEAGIQQFTTLAHTSSGNRATAEVQVDPYFLAVEELADYVRRERARQAIRRFVRVNFGDEAAERRMPKLVVSKIQARNVSVIANAISVLEAAGFYLTDRGVQDDVREMLGFGKLPEAADASGVTAGQLRAALAGAGLDDATVAQVVNGLPADMGVARNRVVREGDGLQLEQATRATVAVTRSLADVGERLERIEERVARDPAPPVVVQAPAAPSAAPITIRLPEQKTEPELLAMYERMVEALERDRPEQPAPTFHVHMPDPTRPRSAVISKNEAGDTIVRYDADIPADE